MENKSQAKKIEKQRQAGRQRRLMVDVTTKVMVKEWRKKLRKKLFFYSEMTTKEHLLQINK